MPDVPIKLIGEFLFNSPFQHCYYHSLIHNVPLSITRHSHDFYEVVIILVGQITQEHNGEILTMNAADMLLIRPDEVHLYISQTAELDLLSMQIEKNEMERFLTAYGLEDLTTAQPKHILAQLDSGECRDIFSLSSRVGFHESEAQVKYYRVLLGLILQAYLFHTADNDIPLWLRMTTEQMTQLSNAAEGVPALVRLSHFSHAQLCRLMKKYMGITPQQYVKDLRLNLARQMIENGDEDYLSISMNVGYNSFSHFCSSFKKKYGCSPSELHRKSLLHMTCRQQNKNIKGAQ